MHETVLLGPFLSVRLGTVKVWDRGVGKGRREMEQEQMGTGLLHSSKNAQSVRVVVRCGKGKITGSSAFRQFQEATLHIA